MSRLLLGSFPFRRLCRNTITARTTKQSLLLSTRHDQQRWLTNQDALSILNLTDIRLTPATLRTAYLEAAKQCHPDTLSPEKKDETSTSRKQAAARKFQLVTQAYQVLLDTNPPENETDFGITIEQDAAFRRACQERLGLPAEIVEESKQCPAFRQWLNGKTDAAHYWRVFFIQHGGLAPQLRPPVSGLLESNQEVKKSSTRRKRPTR